MKAVLISIQPKWCELIASGKKTVEVRKTKPKIETPFKCYIYCTAKKPSDNEWQYKPNLYLDKVENKVRWIDVEFTRTYNCEYLQQRVIGEFVCDQIDEIGYSPEMHGKYISNIEDLHKVSCVDFEQMFDYIADGYGYGWHISDLVIYDEPKELGEFKQCHKCEYYENCYEHEYSCDGVYNLIRPPQSWCYVEELKGE